MERLAALVPAPRFNMIRYSGVLAPSASWRRPIIPKEDISEGNEKEMKEGKTVKKSSQSRPRRYAWAELLPT